MPTYEYQCTKCNRIFECFQSITAKPLRRIETECEQCGDSAPVQRLIGSGAGVLFKGSGFYETDYRSEGYKSAAKAEKEAVEGKKSDGPAKADKAKTETAKAGAGISSADTAPPPSAADDGRKSAGKTPKRKKT